MSAFIARQPNGLLCRFSHVTDFVTHYNMTEDEYIEMCAKCARLEAEENIQHYLHDFSEVVENLEMWKMQMMISIPGKVKMLTKLSEK